KLGDLVLLTISYGLATAIVARSAHTVSVAAFFSMRIKLSNCIMFGAILLAWHIACVVCGLYESRRLSTRQEELVTDFKAATAASFCLLICATLFSIRMVTVPFVFVFWGISTVLMLSGRQVLRFFLGKARRNGRNLRYILIVGTNGRAQ